MKPTPQFKELSTPELKQTLGGNAITSFIDIFFGKRGKKRG